VASHRWQGKAFYQILGVDEGSSLAEIKTEYRWLARKFHPDHNQGDVRAEKKFLEVTEAYEVLVNPASRSEYDRFINSRNSSAGAPETAPKESRSSSNSDQSSKPPYRKPGTPQPPPDPRPNPAPKPRPNPPPPAAKRKRAAPIKGVGAMFPDPRLFDKKRSSSSAAGVRVGFLYAAASLPALFLVIYAVSAYDTTTIERQALGDSTASACTKFFNYPWDELDSLGGFSAAAVAAREWASAPDVVGSVSGALNGVATRLENYGANPTETSFNALSGSWDNAADRCSEQG